MSRDPFGGTYRGRRLSDEETAERMLQKGVEKVNEEGLRISFDLLRLEDLIAEAGVARSAVYRRWATKHHYYADLLRELAKQQHPGVSSYDKSTVEDIVAMIRHDPSKLRTLESRRALAVDLCRLGALYNFELLSDSRSWSVYITLTATLVSLPEDSELQADLREMLAASENVFFEKMVGFYHALLGTLGFRVRSDLEDLSLNTVALLSASVVEGLAIDSISHPEVGAQRFHIDPFCTGQVAEWSMAGIGFASVMFTFIEPIPGQKDELGDKEIEECLELLDRMTPVTLLTSPFGSS